LDRYVAPGAVIQATTIGPPSASTEPLPAGPSAEVLAEFRRVAWGPAASLNPGAELPAGSTTITPALLAALPAGIAFWPEFNRAFPGANGLVGFSRVAFAPRRGEALVYFTHSHGDVAGEGSLILLRWNKAAWRVTVAYRLWVS
jgi:hypothetical protein